MGYEDAKSTLLLATYCACCGRPLRDVKSAEIGIGPVCREKHGYMDDLAPANWERVARFEKLIDAPLKAALDAGDARKFGNILVFRIAEKQSGPEVTTLVEMLSLVGFAKLAAVITEKLNNFIELRFTETDIRINAFFSKEAFGEFIRIPGRRLEDNNRVKVVPVARKNDLWRLLKKHWPGQMGKVVEANGTTKVFNIPAPEQALAAA